MNFEQYEELQKKEKEYCNYIDEHIKNVMTTFNIYGKRLCAELNVSFYKLSIRVFEHDKTKYDDIEFEGYRQWFYPCSFEEKNKELYDKAWEHHHDNNSHHPEHYVKNGKPTGMDRLSIAEMLLDWAAMGIKFGTNTYDYYKKERDIKPFSEDDKKIIDSVIEIFK